MLRFNLLSEQDFSPEKHVEKILGKVEDGDMTVACWEPGQVSPNHCHPHATEIYFCFQGGGVMKTPGETIEIVPGSFVVHPPGELHEYTNGPDRTLLFRVRYGSDMVSRKKDWPSNKDFKLSQEDLNYFAE
ncbi:MAG: cupin domain-containing protein [Methyloligellaceae bacterium]